MKKFTKPEINISMFILENVITTSGLGAGDNSANMLKNDGITVDGTTYKTSNIVKFKF